MDLVTAACELLAKSLKRNAERSSGSPVDFKRSVASLRDESMKVRRQEGSRPLASAWRYISSIALR